ncbi:MAG: hypothetical protein ACHQ7M_01540, partial [Chloroflexota bacterium]
MTEIASTPTWCSRRRFLGLATVGALAVLSACGGGTAASSQQLSKTASGTSLQALIDGAKKEGQLDLFDQTPTTSANSAKLVDAFNKRFGLSTKVNQVRLT